MWRRDRREERQRGTGDGMERDEEVGGGGCGGCVGVLYGPFFSGPDGTVGLGMGSKTLQSFPV